MPFNKSDLQYSYRWSARPEDNPNFRAGADHLEFNRFEGYEMLYVIDRFMQQNKLTAVASGQKLEKLIK